MAQRTLLVMTAVMLLGADTRRDPDLLRTVEASLEGDWVLTYMEDDSGGKMSAKGWTASFRGDKLLLMSDGKLWTEKKVRLHPRQSPAWIDLTFGKDNSYAGKTALGIYRLDGDTLTYRWGWARPKDFTQDQKNNQPVIVMRRVRR
jgi:uncharacterized protein (TIGR03067 family)